MNILLDTNILLMDLTFSKPEQGALRNYLSMTNSKLILPEIVKSEVYKNIASTSAGEVRTIKRLYSKRMGILETFPTREEIELVLRNKFESILNRLSVKSITYGDLSLETLINKSLKETPPFKSEGRGFRDALIWHSLLKHLEGSIEAQVAFITNNSLDFGKEELKPELKKELAELGYEDRVMYFNSLSEFLTIYSETIEFISYDFIYSAVEDEVNLFADSFTESDLNDIEYPSRDYDWDVLGIDYEEFEIDNYYIYNATATHYFVYAEVAMNFNVSLQGTRNDWDYNYMDDDFDHSSGQIRDHSRAHEYREYELKINKETHEVEIIE